MHLQQISIIFRFSSNFNLVACERKPMVRSDVHHLVTGGGVKVTRIYVTERHLVLSFTFHRHWSSC